MSTRRDSDERMTRAGSWFVTIWSVGLLLVYGAAGVAGVTKLRQYWVDTEQFRQTRLAAMSAPAAGSGVPSSGTPVDVSVGIAVNRIGEFDLQQSAWTADFDLWFRWRGDSVRPGESFGVVNGQALSRERMEARADGDRRFERYRVTARLTKSVDPSRFPFADEVLLVELEDAVHGIDTLRYVAEERGDDIGEPVAPQGLDIMRSMTVVTTHHYGRGREDVEPLPGGADARSRFILAVLVQPASGSIYLRMYQALFASVAIALIAFFIKPLHVDPRFGLGIGGFFAAIGNNIFVGTILPSGGRITLSVMVNGVGLATIFFTLVQSAISLYFFDTLGQERLSRVFDRASFVVLLVGYVLVNVALVMAARP